MVVFCVVAQSAPKADESLLEAVKRDLIESTGPNMDVWAPGRVPAGALQYSLSKDQVSQHKGKKEASVCPPYTPIDSHSLRSISSQVFFMPLRIVRGQAVPTHKDTTFAWLTKEEVKEKVASSYWSAVEPLLSDR